jgi:putative transposase
LQQFRACKHNVSWSIIAKKIVSMRRELLLELKRQVRCGYKNTRLTQAGMARLPRLHVPGGYYHVILRGNHQQHLFAAAEDRTALNDIVAEALERYGARIHAFCWMVDHLDLLVQIADRPLGGLMHRVTTRYSRYRHRQLKTTGHLFERRYKAKLVELDVYGFALLRHIHCNPVVAELVRDPADYAWSSHRAYLGCESIGWLTVDVMLALFDGVQSQARGVYADWMANEHQVPGQSLWDQAHPNDGRVLGSDCFLKNLKTLQHASLQKPSLEQLAESSCQGHGIGLDVVRSSSRARCLTKVRVDIARRALEGGIASLSEVSRFLRRSPSALCQILSRNSQALNLKSVNQESCSGMD